MTEQQQEILDEVRARLRASEEAEVRSFEQRRKEEEEEAKRFERERLGAERAEQLRREERQRKHQEAQIEAEKEATRSTWAAAGATDAEFEAAWPTIRRDRLMESSRTIQDQARHAVAARTLEKF